MSDNKPIAVALLAVAVVAGMALFPALVSARPANQIPVSDVSADLSDPTADGWSDVTSVDVALASAPASVPNAGDTSASEVTVQVAKTDSKLFVRMSWADATADESIDGPRAFADAAAVQLPVNTSTRPAIAMGSERQPVNVWYWNPAMGVQEMNAGGVGSVTTFNDSAAQANAVHKNGEWQVVFTRQLTAEADGRTSIDTTQDVDVAFAVWNGSNMERSGQKAVSDWHHMPFGPGPQGPPYESMLWAVAGIAIVVVVAVTATAFRRT